jgi:thioester reductase-like protein
VVELAQTVRNKVLHQSSTLSVFVATDRNTGVAHEDDLLTDTTHVYGGYAQTKWAAERALIPLQQAGAPICIHRLGLITNLETPSDHNFLSAFIQGVAHEPAALTLEDDAVAVDITPQTDAVRILSKLIRHAPCSVYHVASTQSVSLKRLLMLMQQNSMLRLPGSHSSATTHDTHTASARLAMARITQPSAEGWDAWRTMDLFQATDINFDMTRTLSTLPDDPGIEPLSDDRLIQWMMRCVQE